MSSPDPDVSGERSIAPESVPSGAKGSLLQRLARGDSLCFCSPSPHHSLSDTSALQPGAVSAAPGTMGSDPGLGSLVLPFGKSTMI